MTPSVTLRCRACDKAHNPIGADFDSIVDVRDGTCFECFLAFDQWARERAGVVPLVDGAGAIDFARPEVAVAFDEWLEQGR